MERAQGSRWGCLHAAAPLSPLTFLPTLIAASTLYFHLPYWRTGYFSAHLSSLLHLCSIRFLFPLTAYVFPSLLYHKTTFHSVLQYCGHPQVFLMQAMLYLHINTAISSIKPSKMNKTPKTSTETSHKTLPSKYAEESFHPLCSLPKQKRSWKVEVKT